MTRYVRAMTLAAMAAVLVAAAGCAKAAEPAAASVPSQATVDKVTYVTGFGAVGRDAFAWVAKEKGYFRDAGIDVTIQLGAGTDQNLSALTAGQAQFACIDMTGVMVQEGKGA